MKISGELLRVTLLDAQGKGVRMLTAPRVTAPLSMWIAGRGAFSPHRAIRSPVIIGLVGERIGRREVAEKAMLFPDRDPKLPGQSCQSPADEAFFSAPTRGISQRALNGVSPVRRHSLQMWIPRQAAG